MKNSGRDNLSLNQSQRFLLECLRSGGLHELKEALHKIFKGKAPVGSGIPAQWQPYLYRKLTQLYPDGPPLSEGLLQGLKEEYLYNIAKNSYFCREAAAISKAIKNCGISPVFFKGISLINTVYKGEDTRALGDIDFWVRKQDMRLLEPALSGIGYRVTERKDHLHHIYSKNGFGIEPHWKIGLKSQENTLAMLFRCRRAITVLGEKIDILSPEGDILSVCLNFDRTYSSFPAAILSKKSSIPYSVFFFLYDIKRIIGFYGDAIDWDRLLSLAKSDKKEFETFTMILLAEKMLKAKIPARIKEKFNSNIFVRLYSWLIKGIPYDNCLRLCALRDMILKSIALLSLPPRPGEFLDNLRALALTYLYIYQRRLFWASKKLKRRFIRVRNLRPA